jgi:hypothetical protein
VALEEPLEQRILRSQFVEQRFRVLQIGGVEALGEPVVDLCEHRAGFIALAWLHEHPRKARGREQIVCFRADAPGDGDRLRQESAARFSFVAAFQM